VAIFFIAPYKYNYMHLIEKVNRLNYKNFFFHSSNVMELSTYPTLLCLSL